MGVFRAADGFLTENVPDTNGGSLSLISVFFVIIGGFRRRLTKLLLNAVLVLFCGKSSTSQFIRGLLSMRVISTHQSLKEPPFVPDTFNSPCIVAILSRIY